MATYGVTTIQGEARFTSPHRIAVGDRVLTAPRIVLATGSRPKIPDIPGLAETEYLTNETLWDLATLPTHLAILGAGAVGVEMAQAFRRLGSTVDLIDAGTPLAHADPDAAALLLATLRAEGIAIHPHTAIDRIAPGPTLHLATGQTLTPHPPPRRHRPHPQHRHARPLPCRPNPHPRTASRSTAAAARKSPTSTPLATAAPARA